MMNGKKVVTKSMSCILYLLGTLSLVGCLFIEAPIEVSAWDNFLFKLSNVLLLMGIILPIIILTSKKIKLKLPIFKKRKWWFNIFGIIVIFLVFAMSSEMVSSFHTEEFQARYEEYVMEMNDPSETSKEELDEKLNELIKSKEENYTLSHDVSGQLKIHYLDVGQGDSIFLELPTKETMLIDAGEAKEADKIIAYMKSLGYDNIDYVIGTHPHADHIGGLEKIIKTFEIKNIYMPKVVATSKTYENLLKTIAEKNKTVKNAKAGVTVINQEDLQIFFLAPNNDSYTKLNNYSAVLKIKYKEKQFLFMGDAENLIEEEIKESVSADVIKIGHHGSNTSSSEVFVSRVNPSFVVVSVGKDNKYHHPYEEILNRWKNVGAEIYRTDEDGTIKVITDGVRISISSENGKSNQEIIPEANNVKEETDIQEQMVEQEKKTEEITNEKAKVSTETKQEVTQKEQETIELVSFTSSINAGQNATLKIKGKPNTKYSITVIYQKKSTANGLEEKTSDENGQVSWTWKVGTNTKAGTYQVIVSDGISSKEYKLTVN